MHRSGSNREGLLITFIAVIAAMSAGCVSHSTGPTTQSLSGNLMTGKVMLVYDENGNKLTDQSGTEVTVTFGTSVFKDTTATDGTWTIYDPPAGVYTIVATKDGFNDLVEACNATATNVQYVGVGAFTAPTVSLSKDIHAEMISNASASVRWTFYQDTLASGQVRNFDSVAHFIIHFTTQNEAGWNYQVAIAENSSDDCSAAIVSSGAGGVRDVADSSVTFELPPIVYRDLKKHYGGSLEGRTVYIQIRPQFSKKSSPTSSSTLQCLNPQTVPMTF